MSGPVSQLLDRARQRSDLEGEGEWHVITPRHRKATRPNAEVNAALSLVGYLHSADWDSERDKTNRLG